MTEKKSLNIQIPQRTHEQLEALKVSTGMTKTQIVIMALDRFMTELQAAEKDQTHD